MITVPSVGNDWVRTCLSNWRKYLPYPYKQTSYERQLGNSELWPLRGWHNRLSRYTSQDYLGAGFLPRTWSYAVVSCFITRLGNKRGVTVRVSPQDRSPDARYAGGSLLRRVRSFSPPFLRPSPVDARIACWLLLCRVTAGSAVVRRLFLQEPWSPSSWLYCMQRDRSRCESSHCMCVQRRTPG